MISEIDSLQFEKEVHSAVSPVLVEFYSDGCSHCQHLIPILDEVAKDRADRLRVFKFNAGNDPAFASRFRIAAVPNLILFLHGTPIAQRSGFAPKRDILAWVDEAATGPAR
jgi:thioredoxin-like negative regulator of GroEL